MSYFHLLQLAQVVYVCVVWVCANREGPVLPHL